MDSPLHMLCNLCSSITFTLHEPDQCKSISCAYSLIWAADTSLTSRRPFSDQILASHSLLYAHASSFLALKTSAQNGCHLCTLLVSALENSHGRITKKNKEHLPFIEAESVTLVYHATQGKTAKEELEVFCGARCSVLHICDLPPPHAKCDSGVYSSPLWQTLPPNRKLYAEMDTIFYARCVYGRGFKVLPQNGDIEEEFKVQIVEGSPILLTYHSGQVCYKKSSEIFELTPFRL
jgi:hypothetical protein